ncbi:MAG: glycosyltransferase family 39 protein [Phycisphaerales bacterium]|nr:MAG: glycosyltransferase family 39 protein [Phycisphaerales bacterium]
MKNLSLYSATRPNTRKNHIKHLIILLALAAAIGIYLIATAVMISQDGVIYLSSARTFAEKPIDNLRRLPVHPGYLTLTLAADKILSPFLAGHDTESLIISAQYVSLLCRLASIVILYFLGSLLVGPAPTFWALLILIVLPWPARYASDTLSDWPHLLCLSAGLLLLLAGARSGRWWMFGAAGLAAGLGFLIRPECGQLLAYGAAWLLLCLISPKRKTTRSKAAAAIILLVAGFAITAGPYILHIGYLLPERRIGPLPHFADAAENRSDVVRPRNQCLAEIVPAKIAVASGKLAQNICETLMYYFVPPMALGLYCRFRRGSHADPAEQFFILAFIALNVTALVALHHNYGYISKRHTLPVIVITTFYIPLGLRTISGRLQKNKLANIPSPERRPSSLFYVLIFLGLAICTPKLLRPLHADKNYIRLAAQWLAANTSENDLVQVPDSRIAFYAQRPWIPETHTPKTKPKYVVRKLEQSPDPNRVEPQNLRPVFSSPAGRNSTLVIYTAD